MTCEVGPLTHLHAVTCAVLTTLTLTTPSCTSWQALLWHQLPPHANTAPWCPARVTTARARRHATRSNSSTTTHSWRACRHACTACCCQFRRTPRARACWRRPRCARGRGSEHVVALGAASGVCAVGACASRRHLTPCVCAHRCSLPAARRKGDAGDDGGVPAGPRIVSGPGLPMGAIGQRAISNRVGWWWPAPWRLTLRAARLQAAHRGVVRRAGHTGGRWRAGARAGH
jgi:hypothetical protein